MGQVHSDKKAGKARRAGARPARVPSQAREMIGKALKDHYAGLLTEPLPERISALLTALEEQDGVGPGKS